MKCTHHANCKVVNGAHMMTILFEHTEIDMKTGTVTTREYTGKELEALRQQIEKGE